MARSVTEIKKALTDSFISNATIISAYSLTAGQTFDDQFSSVSIESIFFSIVAVAQWTLETLFDLHKTEVTDIIDNLKPHSLRWYSNMAKAFEYGYNLVDGEDYYDNSSLTADQVAAAKIVAYSAVVEQEKNLRVKVAKIVSDDLAPLAAAEKTAFDEYMSRVKDAGVKLVIDSLAADDLSLKLDVYYNPLVMDSTGARLDGTSSSPVQDALRAYLKNLPFNGFVVQAYIIDALQQVDGVVVPVITEAQYKYGLFPFTGMGEIYNPDSGYMRIADEDLTINFIPQSVII